MTDAELESVAELELQAAIVGVLRSATEGQQFGGALVADIHSCAYAEDGRTLIIVVDLEDGRTASISICPGAPVTAAIVG